MTTTAVHSPDAEPQEQPQAERHRWTLHHHQGRVWASPARFKVVTAGRRGGKSELGGMWMIAGAQDDAIRGIPSVNWIVEPTFDDSRDMWRKMHSVAPPGWITGVYGSDIMPNAIRLSSSIIEFRSAHEPKHLVGTGLRRLLVDECGIIKEHAWAESLRPTLMDSSGPALLIGTPKGRNWFHRMYVRGADPEDPEVESFHWTTAQNRLLFGKGLTNEEWKQRMDAEMIAAQRDMPDRHFRQEILAEFLGDEGAVFKNVRAAVWRESDGAVGPPVVLGVDLARTTDFTVLLGLDAKARPAYFERFNQLSWPFQKSKIMSVAMRHNATVVLDATGGSVGDPILQDLASTGIKITGFKFTGQSKAPLIEGLSVAIQQRDIILPDEPVLLNELEAYDFHVTPSGNTQYSAPEGLHDDCVIATALAWYGFKHGTAPSSFKFTL